ncbi:hypothetical protein F7230_00205 [Corynebacterium sp. 320]|uniref:hypothetical protein n=1 Tax=Corynebacterium TaxID=1716 RepID=UPI00125CB7E1|nr:MULTISPECIES: hypothetical protein [Corynebacterium]KAB1503600.1 hypothetical protein F7230_00205 [Corynebacterium sp. 320]KAB1553299.1 hypothetical protein F7233_06385 [Corynebacterium sp. 321]KAB3527736.1 hypothetical protein F8354_00205 [Corynebacterium sp. 250]QNP92957.1 hypothetical protein IAU67_04080 [Corynebacterium zhongnanshanii]
MGRHAQPPAPSAPARSRLLTAVGIAVVIMTLTICWSIYRDTEEQARHCPDGSFTMTVWATPEAKESAKALAKRFNTSQPVAAQHCIKATVKALSDAEAIARLDAVSIDHGSAQTMAGIWIPQDATKAISAARDAQIAVNTSLVSMMSNGSATYALLPISTPEADTIVNQSAGSAFASFAAEALGAEAQVPLSDLEFPRP